MARLPTLISAEQRIRSSFATASDNAFRTRELNSFISSHRYEWGLASSLTTAVIIDHLLKTNILSIYNFDFPKTYKKVTVYAKKTSSLYEILALVEPNGYFSHFSAIWMHGLTLQVPKAIYFSSEQILNSPSASNLEQKNVDNAFKSKPRITSKRAKVGSYEFVFPSVKKSHLLGVEARNTKDILRKFEAKARISSIERTIIDSVTRPQYAGGISTVFEAVSNASGDIDVLRLKNLLVKMNFVYPYHQAIGYLMDVSGKYSERQLKLLEEIPQPIDFYLVHDMKEYIYNSRWKLYVPQAL